MHLLSIRNLGPVKECKIEINRTTVFIGPECGGKSTIAKTVYYFLSVKHDIIDTMVRGGPKLASGNSEETWHSYLKVFLRNKFYRIFGNQQNNYPSLLLKYIYSHDYWIMLHMGLADNSNIGEYTLEIQFSDSFSEYLYCLDKQSFSFMSVEQKRIESERLGDLLNNPFEAVYIPAGRKLVAQLSPQINAIYCSMDSAMHRTIDYITDEFLKKIIQLKQILSNGVSTSSSDFILNIKGYRSYNEHKESICLFEKTSQCLLQGRYCCIDGFDERIYYDEINFIRLNYASSSQQEIVWLLNIMFYYLKEGIPAYIIIEEPELQLFPSFQQNLIDLISLFCNEGNSVLITTHSPYVLGTLNYQLLACQAPGFDIEKEKILLKKYWNRPETLCSYYVANGKTVNALDNSDNLVLINNDLIDSASHSIDSIVDQFLEFYYNSEEGKSTS